MAELNFETVKRNIYGMNLSRAELENGWLYYALVSDKEECDTGVGLGVGVGLTFVPFPDNE